MVELLLAASAAVNGARSDGATPLILASQVGKRVVETCFFLREKRW